MAKKMTLFMMLASLVLRVVWGRSLASQQALTNITANDGQIYNCVDFYKQPTLEDPLFNHQVVLNIEKLQQQRSTSGLLGPKGYGCPIGSVPILDRSKPDVQEFNVSKPPFSVNLSNDYNPRCSARVQTRNDPNKKFFGASGDISIYKPTVQGSQWSSARVKLLNGGDSIEAGWMVNPNVFKDSEAHLYTRFSAYGRGCINLACTGFVQVSTKIPLGIVPHVYSTIGGTQITWDVAIGKHQDDGNWWLSLRGNDIGYWPKNLFTTMKDFATHVEFGGEVDLAGLKLVPMMGNGFEAAYNTRTSSCFFHATVNNENPSDTEKYNNCNLLYSILDGGYQRNEGRVIFYGGPGNPAQLT